MYMGQVSILNTQHIYEVGIIVSRIQNVYKTIIKYIMSGRLL